ncbi:MAG: hypothetical protein Q3999_06335 [Buchananella hordeovulneris]|nr:hypothetical protein [Buchananella hordeovulneris]
MVATLVRLRLRLLRQVLFSAWWRTLLVVIGGLYGLMLLVSATTAVWFMPELGLPGMAGALAVAGGAITLGWMLVPLLASGVDNTLDPRNLAPFVSSTRKVAAGLLLAGGVGIPGVVTALLLALPALGWARAGQPVAAVAALALWPLATATCWLLARVSTAGFAGVGRSRKGRDRSSLILILLLVPFSMLGWLIPIAVERVSQDGILYVANLLAWTPFGAFFAAPASMAQGLWAQAGAQLLIALATAALLWAAWIRLLPKAMLGANRRPRQPDLAAVARHIEVTSADAAAPAAARTAAGKQGGRQATSSTKGALWWPLADQIAKLPGLNQVGAAIAVRSLHYKMRDPRLASIPIMLVGIPLVMLVASSALAQLSTEMPDNFFLASTNTMAFFIGFIMMMSIQAVHADIAYDSTAYWAHVAAGTDPRQEMRGRFFASFLLYIPLVLLVSIATVWRLELTGQFGAVVGGNVGLALAIVGLGYGVGGYLIYPVPPPGGNPFNNAGMGSGGVTMVTQLVLFAGMFLVATPLVSIGLLVPHTLLAQSLLLVGALLYGCALALLGLSIGAKGLAKNQVEFLTRMRSWPKH